jgi:hypothetical protein
MKNPNCDNYKCLHPHSEVRLLPTGGDSNAILCRTCFEHELHFRRQRNRDLSLDCRFDLPSWDSLKVYAPAQTQP